MELKYGPYSPSRLDTATCGYAFKRQYIDKDSKSKRVEGVPQARGSAVHEVFEMITRRLCSAEASGFNANEVRSWVTEAIGRHPAAYPETMPILEMAKLYIERPPKVLVPDAGIELRLAVKQIHDGSFVECDYDDPSALGRGRADIFMVSDDTTTAIVYDHKTQPNVEEADTFQMGFYAWVISKIHPYLDEIRTVLHFARYGHYSTPYVWTKDDLAKVEDEVLTRISIIESRTTWEPTPNKNCQYCPFKTECPALAELIEMLPDGGYRIHNKALHILGDTQRAVKVAGLVNILEELIKEGKDNLKEHVKEFGPIAIPGKIYEFKQSELKVAWDIVNKKLRNQVYEIFEKHKVDPKALMGFSQTFSKSIWMFENQALVDDLTKILPTEIETTFRGSKA